MTSLLRRLVAAPRKSHDETGFDLAYVNDYIIATSGPAHSFPKNAYRTRLEELVEYLDRKHGDDWAIWEFRAEGTGYPDHVVHGRIRHFPYPDHHPPPFALMPRILASMRRWLHGGALDDDDDDDDDGSTIGTTTNSKVTEARHPKRVVVVHCKAGKGRSGTAAVSYLIAEEGWAAEDALARFTESRMRSWSGAGVSIPSQLRWVRYVDRWTRAGRPPYRDRPLEVLEVHVWGLRDGVRLAVEGFADDGRRIRPLHTFARRERRVVQGGPPADGLADFVWDMAGYPRPALTKAPAQAAFADATNNDDATTTTTSTTVTGDGTAPPSSPSKGQGDGEPPADLIVEPPPPPPPPMQPKPAGGATNAAPTASRASTFAALSRRSTASKKSASIKTAATAPVAADDGDDDDDDDDDEPGGMAVIFRPAKPVRVDNSDVNIVAERRYRTHKSLGFMLPTAVAHVWFNGFFEGRGPELGGRPEPGGVFSIAWAAMDGFKGTSAKGWCGFDRMSVVWRFADEEDAAQGLDAATAAAAGNGSTSIEDAPPVPDNVKANGPSSGDELRPQETMT